MSSMRDTAVPCDNRATRGLIVVTSSWQSWLKDPRNYVTIWGC